MISFFFERLSDIHLPSGEVSWVSTWVSSRQRSSRYYYSDLLTVHFFHLSRLWHFMIIKYYDFKLTDWPQWRQCDLSHKRLEVFFCQSKLFILCNWVKLFGGGQLPWGQLRSVWLTTGVCPSARALTPCWRFVSVQYASGGVLVEHLQQLSPMICRSRCRL